MKNNKIVHMFYKGYSIKQLTSMILYEDKIKNRLKADRLTKYEALSIVENAIVENLKKGYK